MGTHSLIIMRVKNAENFTPICALYQQFDGGLEYVGKILLEFLSKITITNGIRMTFVERKLVTPPNTANGSGCLFAQIVKLFKKDVGGAYLINPVIAENDPEEYTYFIDVDEDLMSINVRILVHGDILYEGSPSNAFSECMKKIEGEEKQDEMDSQP